MDLTNREQQQAFFLFSEWLCKSEIALPLLSREVKKY